MTLSFKQILSNSFVVSINEKRYAAFEKEFSAASFPILPKKFIGYEITDKYLLDSFQILADLKNLPKHGILEKNLRMIYSICNNASHFAIVQHAKLLDLPFVTIFEDDAVPIPQCIEKLNVYCSDIPDNTDVLRLGYSTFPEQKQLDIEKCDLDNHSENLIVKNFCGSHAYIVFKKYYMRFLKDNKYQPRCDCQKINPTPDKTVYALKEPLFIQQNILDASVIHSYKLKNGMRKLPPVS